MKLSSIFFPAPFKARHAKRTFVSSPDDEASRPDRALIEFALDAVRRTLDVDISEVAQRAGNLGWRPDNWPGEHYRLLAGMVDLLQPKCVIEIGTFTGISAFCLKKYLPAGSTITTFDLVPWNNFDDTALRSDDFADGRLKQEIADLSNPSIFRNYMPLLAQADFMFIDGPKDNRFEPALAQLLNTIQFTRAPWVVFDDIRDLNMLKFWRELDKPKLDISSFGHWTGTGLVRWENGTR